MIEVNKYLIITEGSRKWNANVKLTNTLKGKMPSNAVVMKLNLQLPESLFKKPQLQASIKINEEDVSKPVINAQTLDNIREVLNKQLGVDVTIQHVEPDLEFLNYNVELKDYLKNGKKGKTKSHS